MKIYMSNFLNNEVFAHGGIHKVYINQNDQNLLTICDTKKRITFSSDNDPALFLSSLFEHGEFNQDTNCLDIDPTTFFEIIAAHPKTAEWIIRLINEYNLSCNLKERDIPNTPKITDFGFMLNFNTDGSMDLMSTVDEVKVSGASTFSRDEILAEPWKIFAMMDAVHNSLFELYGSGHVHADPHVYNRLFTFNQETSTCNINWIDLDSIYKYRDISKLQIAHSAATAFVLAVSHSLNLVDQIMWNVDGLAAANWRFVREKILDDLHISSDSNNFNVGSSSIYEYELYSKENYEIVKNKIKYFLFENSLVSKEVGDEYLALFRTLKNEDLHLKTFSRDNKFEPNTEYGEKMLPLSKDLLMIINKYSYQHVNSTFTELTPEVFASFTKNDKVKIFHTVDGDAWVCTVNSKDFYIINKDYALDLINAKQSLWNGHLMPCARNELIRCQMPNHEIAELEKDKIRPTILVNMNINLSQNYMNFYKQRYDLAVQKFDRIYGFTELEPVLSSKRELERQAAAPNPANNQSINIQRRRVIITEEKIGQLVEDATQTLRDHRASNNTRQKQPLHIMKNSRVQPIKYSKKLKNAKNYNAFDTQREKNYKDVAFARSLQIRSLLLKSNEVSVTFVDDRIFINEKKYRTLDEYGRTVTVELNTFGSGFSRYVKDVNGRIMYKKRVDSFGKETVLTTTEKTKELRNFLVQYAILKRAMNTITNDFFQNKPKTEANINKFIKINGVQLDFLGMQLSNVEKRLKFEGLNEWQIDLGSAIAVATENKDMTKVNKTNLNTLYEHCIFDSNNKAISNEQIANLYVCNKKITDLKSKMLEENDCWVMANPDLEVAKLNNELVKKALNHIEPVFDVANSKYAKTINANPDFAPLTMVDINSDPTLSPSVKIKDKLMLEQQSIAAANGQAFDLENDIEQINNQ